jgi:hypothetical protein
MDKMNFKAKDNFPFTIDTTNMMQGHTKTDRRILFWLM